MFLQHQEPPVVLASGSPRRQQLLGELGIRHAVQVANIDESPRPGEDARQLVGRLAMEKAARVASARGDALVIAADTVVVLDDVILGKPLDRNENREFLKRLAGRSHEVFTGHALQWGERRAVRVVRTQVEFRELSGAEIERYLAAGEGLDKAGGYAIQGRGAALVPRIDGCYFNVVGMSLVAVVEMAAELGVPLV